MAAAASAFKPLKKGTTAVWETAGRGGRNRNTGTIVAFVPKGELAGGGVPKSVERTASNRDRYVIKVGEGDVRYANAKAVSAK